MDAVAICKKQASDALEMFVRNLGHVPADKLEWSPSPTAKNALQIVAHCSGYSFGFAGIIRNGRFPEHVEDFIGPINAKIASISTVEQAVEVLKAGMGEVQSALDVVQPHQVGSVLETPIGPTSFMFFMSIPAIHLNIHMGQIDYLQTCWDDQEIYF